MSDYDDIAAEPEMTRAEAEREAHLDSLRPQAEGFVSRISDDPWENARPEVEVDF